MKVKFTACGGWDYEKDSAKKELILGDEYIVEWIIIDSWSTYLRLENGKSYNHCLFQTDPVIEEIIRTGKYDGDDVKVSVRC